ncbi:MAG: hypothetical protein R3D29_14085 [Nitratireductor sp.]
MRSKRPGAGPRKSSESGRRRKRRKAEQEARPNPVVEISHTPAEIAPQDGNRTRSENLFDNIQKKLFGQ